MLTVCAEHEETEEKKNDHYLRRERRYGSASRSISLPKGVTPDQVEATCRDGIVEVSVPKPTRGSAQRRRLRVSSGPG
jgi:HSP20 family protein